MGDVYNCEHVKDILLTTTHIDIIYCVRFVGTLLTTLFIYGPFSFIHHIL